MKTRFTESARRTLRRQRCCDRLDFGVGMFCICVARCAAVDVAIPACLASWKLCITGIIIDAVQFEYYDEVGCESNESAARTKA